MVQKGCGLVFCVSVFFYALFRVSYVSSVRVVLDVVFGVFFVCVLGVVYVSVFYVSVSPVFHVSVFYVSVLSVDLKNEKRKLNNEIGYIAMCNPHHD
jgi:hypothetical protein